MDIYLVVCTVQYSIMAVIVRVDVIVIIIGVIVVNVVGLLVVAIDK